MLRPHQQRLKDEDPDKALLVHEMRTGKSIIGKNWIESPRRNNNGVVVCLKSNKKEWQALCPDATVYTKEEFKKHIGEIIKSKPSAIVVDEASNFFAPLFITRKRSQQAEAIYSLIKEYPDMHVLLLTATPLTNDPASLHTALTYIGKYEEWKEFQKKFYTLQHLRFLPRPAWFPNTNWRREANEILKEHADIVSLADCIDSLPPSSHEVIEVKGEKYDYDVEEDEHWTKDHIAEQYNKYKTIKELGSGFRKVILVCHYTEQIDSLAKKLENDKPVFILDGRTKDSEALIKEAQESPDCYLIVQAKMGMGWDGYMFGCMIFVSMAHRQIDFTQMLGRLTSVDHQKPMLYFYLVAKGESWDRKIYDSLKSGENFNPHKA